MRPRSITGPVILVLIGVVFLMNNVWHDIPFWTLLSDYWPLMLILIGLLGVAEVLFYVARGADLPPRPMAGTGFFWILILCMFSLWGGAHAPLHLGRLDSGGVTILGTDYEYDVNATSGAQGITRVVLDNIQGNLSLKGEDSGDVKITGRKTVRAFNRNDADRANQQSQIRVERQGDLLVIRAEEPRSLRMLSVTADLDITLPKTLNVEARGRSGDLTVEDLRGTIDVTNGHGDIRLNDIGKDVRIEASRSGLIHASDLKGNLDVEGRGGDVQIDSVQGQVTINGEYSGTLEFHSLAQPLHFQSSRSDFRAEQIPGNVTIDLGNVKMSDVVGPVRFQTGSRDIVATDVTNSLDLSVDHGDIQVIETRTPLPKMDVRARNGDISVTVPGKAGFDVDARAAQGEVQNDYGDPIEAQTEGHSGTLRGHTGSGPKLSLISDRGRISLRKD